MNVLYLIALIGLLGLIYSYENLCRRPTTVLTQSSTYPKQGVGFANDGNKRSKARCCSRTADKQPKAWLQVDLGQPFSIKNVQLYFPTDDYWSGVHIRQFYLDVSDVPAKQSTTYQRTRCYTDTTTDTVGPRSIKKIRDIQCYFTARYVIVESHYISPENDPSEGAVLEICEIEVFGCEVGRFGANCTLCRGCQLCDIVSGECVLTGLTKQQDSKDENMLILYAISAVLSMSLIINGFLLVWILRHRTSRRRDVNQEKKPCGTQEIHNTLYQELGQVIGPSQYDQLHSSSLGFTVQ